MKMPAPTPTLLMALKPNCDVLRALKMLSMRLGRQLPGNQVLLRSLSGANGVGDRGQRRQHAHG